MSIDSQKLVFKTGVPAHKREAARNVYFGFTDLSCGQAGLAWSNESGLLWLGFSDQLGRDAVISRIEKYLPAANLIHDGNGASGFTAQIERNWRAGTCDMTATLYGTSFQIDVWRALLGIDRGQTVSYSSIANNVNRPKAVRAVGSAVGANPVSLLVPCHRVLHAGGGISHYGWGINVKESLLNLEAM